MPPVEAWKRVFVDEKKSSPTLHASVGCITCHGGTPGASDQAAAHAGVVRSPTASPACASCHPEQVKGQPDSLHFNLKGYTTVLSQRSDPAKMPAIEKAMGNHCNNCHAGCGDCHVSRPTSAGGGLLDGHVFKKTPPMNLTCTACHGSRVNDEYKGKNKDASGKMIKADVHYAPGGMTCVKCHPADAMHGATGAASHRYDGARQPSCTQQGCHEGITPGSGPQHTAQHLERLECQVCHSVAYKSCYSCHVQLSDDGAPYFKTQPSQMAFKIGLNPIQSEARPYKYVVVRHVPIDRRTFEYYGDDLLPNFDARPTWTYATPHNIQKKTPQNADCQSCHNNKELFLTEDAVAPDEREANKNVIVRQMPPPM